MWIDASVYECVYVRAGVVRKRLLEGVRSRSSQAFAGCVS